MATSGTYLFEPNLGEFVLQAFNAIGVRSTALTQEHMTNARFCSNLVLIDFSNRGVDLWQVEPVTITLIPGQKTYPIDASTVVILDAYFQIISGNQPFDRIILPVSRSEYASYPNKEMQAPPTVFWHDRTASQTITLYPVPSQAATLTYYRLRQAQDSNFLNGQSVEVVYLWYAAFFDALVARLAGTWAPERAAEKKADAAISYATAAERNIEKAQVYITPNVRGYYRP